MLGSEERTKVRISWIYNLQTTQIVVGCCKCPSLYCSYCQPSPFTFSPGILLLSLLFIGISPISLLCFLPDTALIPLSVRCCYESS